MSNKAFRIGGKLRVNMRTRCAGVTPGGEYWIEDIIPVEGIGLMLWVRGVNDELVMLFDTEAHSIVNTLHMCETCYFSDDPGTCEFCYNFSEYVEYVRTTV